MKERFPDIGTERKVRYSGVTLHKPAEDTEQEL
jgi:hypothetical protein